MKNKETPRQRREARLQGELQTRSFPPHVLKTPPDIIALFGIQAGEPRIEVFALQASSVSAPQFPYLSLRLGIQARRDPRDD
jgi:hypothetical protein